MIQTHLLLPLMEEATACGHVPGASCQRWSSLLKEQRRTMTLFLKFLGSLSGDNLQAKLLEVLDTTRSSARGRPRPEPALIPGRFSTILYLEPAPRARRRLSHIHWW